MTAECSWTIWVQLTSEVLLLWSPSQAAKKKKISPLGSSHMIDVFMFWLRISTQKKEKPTSGLISCNLSTCVHPMRRDSPPLAHVTGVRGQPPLPVRPTCAAAAVAVAAAVPFSMSVVCALQRKRTWLCPHCPSPSVHTRENLQAKLRQKVRPCYVTVVFVRIVPQSEWAQVKEKKKKKWW